MRSVEDIFQDTLSLLKSYQANHHLLSMQKMYIFGWIHGVKDVNVIDNETMKKWNDEVNKY